MCIRDRPYVESVSILRGLPSTITFQVTEWDAVAQVEVYAQGQTEESGEEGESQQAAAKETWLCLLYTSRCV